MVSDEILRGFVKLSQSLGKSPAYVQGGGGNTSAKGSSGSMLVKASGLLLADVCEDAGFAEVDFGAVRRYIQDAAADENTFNERVCSFNSAKRWRPSMEVGMHAVLDGFVAHTHSVYTNVICCSVQGKKNLEQILPDAVWVPYASPGRALTLAINSAYRSNPRPSVFFLQNHGLVVCAQSATEAIALHEEVNERVRLALGLDADFDLDTEKLCDLEYMSSHILFPDQAVYTAGGRELLGTQAAQETLAAYAFIRRCIDDVGFEPNFLQVSDVAFLLNMDAEKYRVEVAK